MTTTQLELELAPLTQPDYAPSMTIQERYEAWLAANPWVLDWMLATAEDWLKRGGNYISAKHLCETLRAAYFDRIKSDDFSVNNDYSSRLARDLIARRPHLAAVIRTRALRAA